MKIGVTGSTSSIGGAITKRLIQDGHDVTKLVRKPLESKEKFYDIKLNPKEKFDFDLLVHTAWDRSKTAESSNYQSMKRLTSCLPKDSKIIFISTLSAYSKSSKYGLEKRMIEELVLENKGLIIRAGILWGENPSGMIGNIMRLSSIPYVCLHLYPDPELFLTDIGEVVQIVSNYCQNNIELEGVYDIYDSAPIRLSKISHLFQPQFKIHVIVPTYILNIIIKIFKKLGIPLIIDSDNIKGLYIEQMDQSQVLKIPPLGNKKEFIDWVKRLLIERI